MRSGGTWGEADAAAFYIPQRVRYDPLGAQLRAAAAHAQVDSIVRNHLTRLRLGHGTYLSSRMLRPSFPAPAPTVSPVEVQSRRPTGQGLRGWLLLLWFAGCSGQILDDPGGAALVPQIGPASSGGAPGPGAGTAAGPAAKPGGPDAGASSGSAPSACADGRVEPRAVLVAPRQYVNLLHDLIGAAAVTDQDAAASSELLVETVDRPWVTTAMLDRFVRMAEHATETLRGKTATFLACPSLMDATCVRGALSRIAHQAYKRPIMPDELDQLMVLRDMGISGTSDMGEAGALTALQAILIAPSTLYRTEFQAPLVNKRRSLTVHERAAALAAMLLDSIPDPALLAAADDGSLDTPVGLQAQIDRLLQLPRVRQHLTQVVLTAYNVPRIFSTPKDPALFPGYTPALQNSMYEETRRFVEDVLWTRAAPIGELLTSRRSFVDGALAKHYGLAAPAQANQFQPTMLPPERAGLLTQASVMSVLSRTDKSSVVARGLFVRGNLLCLPKIPGPPMSVQAQVAMQLGATSSQKELAAYRAMTSPCSSCHAQFDRFGLLLESFDPIGKFLPQQSEPVDFTGLSPLDGVVMNVEALATRIERDHLFEQCFADRILSYALTVATEPEELCLLAPPPAAAASKSPGSMRDLIAAVVQSPAWSERNQAEP